MFNPNQVKDQFPILSAKVHGKPLVYLDNAATSQKPQQVLDAITEYYTTANANVHRGVHSLSDASTEAWEASRETIANFFDADIESLIVTRNTTEALNGIAYGWGDAQLNAGDVILTTPLEHHSSIVVWQQLAARTEAKLEVLDVDQLGRINLDDLEQKLDQFKGRLKLISFVHVSNTLGTVQPINTIVDLVRSRSKYYQPKIAIDVAQSAPHMALSFKKLDIDFMVLSGHKMLGPMGFGALFVKKELLESNEMKPWLYGGGMIDSVSEQETLFHQDPVERFTAGTPDVATAVGMAAACKFLSNLGMSHVEEHDRSLVGYAVKKLSEVKEVSLIGPLEVEQGEDLDRLGSVAFTFNGVHAHDVAQILDSQGVAVRSGHHCTMPLHQKFGWQATVRSSFQVYNSTDEIDMLISALEKVKKTFLS